MGGLCFPSFAIIVAIITIIIFSLTNRIYYVLLSRHDIINTQAHTLPTRTNINWIDDFRIMINRECVSDSHVCVCVYVMFVCCC